MGERNYSFDANTALADGAAAQTANGYAQYAGADGVWDTGGNQGVTYTEPSIDSVTSITPQQARVDAVIALWITAIVTSGTDKYVFMVLGSNDPAFGAGNVQILGALEFGTAGSFDVVNGITTPAPNAIGGSMYEILFTTEQNNVKYQFVKLYVVMSGGTAPSLTFKAFGAVLPIA